MCRMSSPDITAKTRAPGTHQASHSEPSLDLSPTTKAQTFITTPGYNASTATAIANQATPRQSHVQPNIHDCRYDPTPSQYVENTPCASTKSKGWTESLVELCQRGLAAKRDAHSKLKQIPPFVQKLRSFLDETENSHLIRWSDDGNSFIIADPDEFAKSLIPELFKHNTYASFVRQLNMYGFHKKLSMSDKSVRAIGRGNRCHCEYSHPFFKRDHPDLLWLIRKPKNTTVHAGKGSKGGTSAKREVNKDRFDGYGDDGTAIPLDARARSYWSSVIADRPMPKEQVARVHRELKATRQLQSTVYNSIVKLRNQHEQLHAQVANFRRQHTCHENSINAIITFIANVYKQDGSQSLIRSLAGTMSDEKRNVADLGSDAQCRPAAADSQAGQQTMKKQPLHVEAHSVVREGGRSSPSSTSDIANYGTRDNTGKQNALQPGQVEGLLDASPHDGGNDTSICRYQYRFSSQDSMSIFQSSNSMDGIPTSASPPNETFNRNIPLTPHDMRRLIASNTKAAEQARGFNNALATPAPRQVSRGCSGGFGNAPEIDSLVKMQSDHERSIGNLTNLPQPSCRAGVIPGVDGEGNVPPLTLDQAEVGITGNTYTDRQDEENFVDTLFNLENIAGTGDLFHDSSHGSRDFRG